jgi:hypothetical protein
MDVASRVAAVAGPDRVVAWTGWVSLIPEK